MATVPEVPSVPTAPIAGTPPAQNNPVQQQINSQQIKPQQPFKRIYYTTVRPGSLLSFQYTFYKHDPYPLVLSTGKWADGKIAGINLHYLTFNYMKNLINQFCGKNFNYQSIKNDKFIRKSFRSYQREGVRNIKLMDCQYLNQLLGNIRTYNPTEVEAMRQYIRKQLNQQIGTKASDMTGNPVTPPNQGTVNG